MNPMTGLRFHWALVFRWEPSVDSPFDIFPLEALPEVPKAWIEFPLPKSYRHKRIDLEVTGKNSSIFAKIEYGRGFVLKKYYKF